MEYMQRNNAKDNAVEGGDDGEGPPSSQPIAPAVAGQAPPQPAGKSIAYFTEGRGNAPIPAILGRKYS